MNRNMAGSGSGRRMWQGTQTRLAGHSTMHRAAARCATHTARSDVVAGVVTAHAPSPSVTHTADVENVVVVGSGPAGYTAAIYAGRANLKPVVFEGFLNGQGGQLMGTTEVENFPGFPEGVTGPDLMDRMRKQAERWGAEMYTEDVESIDFSSRPFTVRTSEREVKAHSLILATGATARRLGFPTEQAFWSKGISACAICDGASPLFKDRPVAVVGGGDSAAEEAVYLTKYASRVHLLVRGERLRASKAMADRAVNNPRITVHYNTTVLAAAGETVLAALELQDTKTGTTRQLDVAGLFYGIGHQPNTKLFSEHVELDALGYVRVQHGVETSLEGVFAAGDLHDSEWRQAITAAGAGCMAALSVERYLTMNNLGVEFKQSSPEESPVEELPSSHTPPDDAEELFDMMQDKHRGQFALRKLYHESDRLIAVLYSAPSCGPCRTLKPIFNAVVDEYRGRIHYVEVDIEQDPEVAEAAGVTGTPTVQFFKGKDMITLLPGVRQKREYRELLTAHI